MSFISSFLEHPTIISGIIAFIVFYLAVKVFRKTARVVAIILGLFILVGGSFSVKLFENKYELSYKDKVIKATIEGKEIKLDLDKLKDAKISTQRTSDGIKMNIEYKDGTVETIVIPNMLYKIIRLKVEPIGTLPY